jgi:hypothetical protein
MSDVRWCRDRLGVHAGGMESLPGAEEAAERLKQTALRDFGRPRTGEVMGKTWRMEFPPHDAPVPRLLKYALNLIGLESYGPDEKVEWWVNFTYKGECCELAHQKFGVRLYLWTEAPAEEARKTLIEVAKKLRSSVRTVEKVILAAAPDLLGKGNATVVNQHSSLRNAYTYFRERALNPTLIEDERVEHEVPGLATAFTFKSGQIQMRVNAFHDLVAAITAFLSLLEHDLVLALAFTGFDPAEDDLTEVIRSRWSEKFDRVLGKGVEAIRYRERLTDVVERWRNPYSHGGFEKGHGATIYLHTPGVGAIPVGLTGVRKSPLFSFIPANETDVAQVFALLDEIDRWLESKLLHPMQWVNSGLAVRFDEGFRKEAAAAVQADQFQTFVDYHSYRQDMADNMDY